MGCITSCGRALITNIIGILMLVASVVMICLIVTKLTNYDVQGAVDKDEHLYASFQYKCLLTTDDTSQDVCKAGYIANGISLAATLYIMITACWLCPCWTFIGGWIDWLVTTAGTVFWVIISVVFTKHVREVDASIEAQTKFRHVIVLLCWGLALKFGILCVMSHVRVLTTCCSCCSGSSSKARHHKIKNDDDVENAKHHGHAAPAMNHQYAPMNY